MFEDSQTQRGMPGGMSHVTVEGKTEAGSKQQAARQVKGDAARPAAARVERSAGGADAGRDAKPRFEDWLLGLV